MIWCCLPGSDVRLRDHDSTAVDKPSVTVADKIESRCLLCIGCEWVILSIFVATGLNLALLRDLLRQLVAYAYNKLHCWWVYII